LIALTLVSLSGSAYAESLRKATQITVQSDAKLGRSEVVVSFSATPTFTARYERQAKRLLIDVAGAESALTQPTLLNKEGCVAGVLTQTYEREGGKVVRVFITLRNDAAYSIQTRGNDLVVSFTPESEAARGTPKSESSSATTSPLSTVEHVDFDASRLVDRITLELDRIPKYRLVQVDAKRTQWILEGASLAPSQARILDVSALTERIERVACFSQHNDASVNTAIGATKTNASNAVVADAVLADAVVIDVTHEPSVVSRIEREGSRLVLEMYRNGTLPSSMTGVARDGGAARRTQRVSGNEVVVDESTALVSATALTERGETGSEEVAGVTPALLAQQAADRYAGRRIDLDLKDADIHNVLRLLAEVGRVNVVTADNVQGNVTIRMRNVPWDQALDVILQAKGLGMVRRANMIRVAPLDVLQKERELAIQQAAQEVQLTPIETRLIPVSYANAADIQLRAKDLLSERGSIAVDERTNVMIVRDVPGNLNQIEELTRALDTQTPQVLIEARIVEATSRYNRDVGIQWGGDATFSGATANPTGLTFPNSIGIVGGASDTNTPSAGLSAVANRVETPNFAVNLPAAVGTGQGGALGLTFGSIDNTINLALRLSAAEASGMIRILSSPRVLALDNREARISQGTLIPFSQISAQGVQTTFQEAKLQLLVRPHVTADGSVAMKVKINRDEPDFTQTSARGDPTILKREAETELLVMDGHTAVIGGIFTRNTGRNLDQVPFFGDIPIIGLLFQRRRSSDVRGELVIFLTPRIVNRSEALGR
jgi:type IV pilus assembly protein PilQ